MDPVLVCDYSHLCTVLLEDQRGRWNQEYFSIHWCRDDDFTVRARPQGFVIVVDGEDRHGGAGTHVEPLGDRQKLAGEMAIGQLRNGHIGGQARIEKRPKRLGDTDEEAHHAHVGDGKEVADRAGSTDRAFLIDVVADVDVANGHHSVIGRNDRFESNQGLVVSDVLFRRFDLRRLCFRLGDFHRDRLFGHCLVRA